MQNFESETESKVSVFETREGVVVRTFTEGKDAGKNEDFFAFNDNTFVLVDGATDKSGQKYDGRTGGEIVSRVAADECLRSELNGQELVDHLNKKIKELYEQSGITDKVNDPKYRFTCSFVCVRAEGNRILITYLGDAGFRINGKELHQEIKAVDIDRAEKRAKYIRETEDVEGGRAHILPELLEQLNYQNKEDEPFGFGVIDGTATPAKFIKTFTYPKKDIKTIELFSDGYPAIPEEVTIGAWENAYKKVDEEDPDRWKTYKGLKSKDDRTVSIISFQ